ncbi:leukocyte surface antigen CD53-like [Pararge aegeria]|uniref:leukocyte surface antigen CD53-like n=1 Tax=Pararge aegeria TaxID=116150 RepID=UPI0019D2CA5E|nr:leukocyte surface antigen CD53-like [Pararge aegeria]
MKVPKVLKSLRYSLVAVNSLFLVTGFILLTVGLIALNTYNLYGILVTSKFFTVPNFAIATAAIIFFTAVLGYYGAISEQFYFIAGYVALLVVILIFEITITVLGFELQNKAVSEIRRPMIESMQQYGKMDVSIAWDNLQMGFECCGISGEQDWTFNRLPVSCCHINPGTISPFECTSGLAYERGCQSVLGEWLGYNAYAIGVTAAFVTCLQVLITAAAAWLAYRSKFEEVELER